MQKIQGWLLGQPDISNVEDYSVRLGAPWAQEPQGMFWLFAGIAFLCIVALAVYTLFQNRGSLPIRIFLAVIRCAALAMLIFTLADPLLNLTSKNVQYPFVYVLFDGTDSMAIADKYSAEQEAALSKAIGEAEVSPATRVEYVQAWLNDPENPLARLQSEKNARVRAYVYDGNSTSQLRKLNISEDNAEEVDPAYLSGQLTTTGQVTALGATLNDVGRQFGVGNLAGVVMVSDFSQNSGQAPIDNRQAGAGSPALSLGAPIYSVGVGSEEMLDLGVALQTNPQIKQGIETTITVKLRQQGLAGSTARVRVWGVPLGDGGDLAPVEIGVKEVTLQTASQAVEFTYKPEESGEFEFFAAVEPLDGEVVSDNNRDMRQVRVIDDYFRLMYVAYEPTWEWRFVKEVFHRDPLVGMEGFRTFLASSDVRVRASNVLFLPSLTPKRSDFFANDVVFLGDTPRDDLTTPFCNQLKEFVGKFGGGLVVICGPRFGGSQLAGTPIADMLPVVLDPAATLKDDEAFQPRRTSAVANYPFMRLAESDAENEKAWGTLRELPWYQPVMALHPDQCTVLAEHPTDLCADGVTPQPIIAVRQYGAGEVVYIGFNETWRLRRMYGDKYYTRFWGQLINRLAISHALGDDKRFEVRANQQQYQIDDKAIINIRAYDENYEPLTEEQLGAGVISGELSVTNPKTGARRTRTVELPLLRDGEFEARVPLDAAGDYSLKIQDPISDQMKEIRFEAITVSAERRSGIRNARLQEDLARATGGRSYTLVDAGNLVDDINVEPTEERITRTQSLWTTPLWFILLMSLLLVEWLIRKLVHLR